MVNEAYLSGGDHDTNLFDSFGEFIRFNSSIVIKIEILERFHEYGLLALGSACLLGQLVLQLSLKTIEQRLAHHAQGVIWGQSVAQTTVKLFESYLTLKDSIPKVVLLVN